MCRLGGGILGGTLGNIMLIFSTPKNQIKNPEFEHNKIKPSEEEKTPHSPPPPSYDEALQCSKPVCSREDHPPSYATVMKRSE